MTLIELIQSKTAEELTRWYQALKQIPNPNRQQQQLILEIEDYLWEEYRL